MEMTWTNLTIVFQLLYIVFIIVIVYAAYYLAIKLPRDSRERNAKLNNIEKTLDEISKEFDR